MVNQIIKDKRKQLGNSGEDRAAEYLIEHGYELIARNWRTRYGEIDIIVCKDEMIVFVEVKTLPGGNAELLAHELDSRKQKRIVETSKRFLINNRKYSNDYVRFDVIVVDMPGYDPIYHIENAFSGNL